MLNDLQKTLTETVPHVWSMLKQLFVPTLLAAVYGLWDWSSSGGNFELAEYLKIVMPALFFLMWFVGLYERQKKRSSDSQSFNALDQKLESLSDAVSNLNHSHHRPAPTLPSKSEESFSQSIMTEAETVFESGHHLAALLQGGVAFEQAVRSFAKSRKLADADRMPLLHILKKVDFLLPNGVEGELHALRQVRNKLAHASERELRDVDQAERILVAYRWAIDTLEGEVQAQAHNKKMQAVAEGIA